MRNPLSILPQRLRANVPSAFRAITEMENEMNQWLQSPFVLPETVEGYDFMPTCNLKENDKEYIAQFDIPGVRKDDVKIEINDGRMTVSGERRDTIEEKESRRYFSETYYGSFIRSFTLPSAVDENKVEAHYEDGVLIVKIPKLATTKTKEIKIH